MEGGSEFYELTGSGNVDLSFVNSVTGSEFVAKGSNILQDMARESWCIEITFSR